LNWRWIFRLPALLLLIGGVTYYCVARNRPEDLGCPALNDAVNDAPQELEAVRQEAPAETSRERYRHVLSNTRFLIASSALGFQNLARYALLVWVPVHFLGEDWENSDTKWVSIALPVGMALGAIASGWISDRFFGSNRSRVIGLFLFLAACCSMAMYFLPRNHWLAVPMLMLTGFFAYGPQSAFWALCPDLLGHERAGTGTGVMNTFAYVFAGLGEPFIGRMIDISGRTSLVFAIVAAACLVGALISPLIRR
jgi:OPA family glycerol-3-phosphate transporter-like MFS transporter